MRVCHDIVFTSTLDIRCEDSEDFEYILSRIPEAAKIIEERYSFFNKDSLIWKSWKDGQGLINPPMYPDMVEGVEEYCNLIHKPDITCCLKGFFLSLVTPPSSSSNRYIIDFGGDIYAQGEWPILIEGTKIKLKTSPSHRTAIFSSGNYGRRGEHIRIFGDRPQKAQLLTCIFQDTRPGELASWDAYTTLAYSQYPVGRSEGVTKIYNYGDAGQDIEL